MHINSAGPPENVALSPDTVTVVSGIEQKHLQYCNMGKDACYAKNGGLDNPAFVSETDLDAKVVIEQEEIDPWALPELQVDFTPWAELNTCGKLRRVFLHYILKFVLLLCFLYIFICSLSFLGDAFKLLGGKAAGKALSENEIVSNPVAGLMIGVMCTVLLQSSSTTTSIVVSMVGSDLLTVRLAIPIVMGANIGTSVTNTIVSIGQITNKNDFRRAFAGATVHDVFNWLTVLVLLPLEVITGYLEWLSGEIVNSLSLEPSAEHDRDYLKVITDPLTKLVIQLDKKVITNIAKGITKGDESVIKHTCCDKVLRNVTSLQNVTESKTGTDGALMNVTMLQNVSSIKEVKINCNPCKFLFEKVSRDSWSDEAVGAVVLVIALFLLCVCLVAIVKLLHSLLKGQIAHAIRKFINAEFPGYCSYFTGYLAILVGAGLTVLVQSSSIFTSSITPLVGIGVMSVERMYPLTLGSNIGTTATGIIAAFAQDEEHIKNSLQIALCHLFFNISGIMIFYPLPFFRPPIRAAKFLGSQTAKYRWFAILYLILAFFLLPAFGFALSLVSWIAMAAVFIPIGVIIIVIAIMKVLQNKRPQVLPVKLRNWKWLPVWLRSLEPMDRMVLKITCHYGLCRKCNCCDLGNPEEDKKNIYKNGTTGVAANGDGNVMAIQYEEVRM